jgi:hypothetical protein
VEGSWGDSAWLREVPGALTVRTCVASELWEIQSAKKRGRPKAEAEAATAATARAERVRRMTVPLGFVACGM